MATVTEIETPVEVEASPPKPSMPADPFFRIGLDLYDNMVELGLLGPRDRIELLDGMLVNKMTKGDPHIFATLQANDLLKERLPAGYSSRHESPIALPKGPDGDSAPELDVAVVRGNNRDYRLRKPVPDDVLLVIEVAHGSLASDRAGLRRYAWAGIPIVWIVNLRNQTVEVYDGPSGPVADPGYERKVTKKADESLELRLDDGTVIALPASELFS